MMTNADNAQTTFAVGARNQATYFSGAHIQGGD
jgi:hypothetical protein